MKNYQWLSVGVFGLIILFLSLFQAFKSQKTYHIKNGLYQIKAKVLKPKEILVLSPPLKDKILNINIKLPQNAYIKGFIKVENNKVKTSYDFLEISAQTPKKNIKDILKSRFKNTTTNDWSKDIGLALLFGEGTKALPEDLLTVFSVNSLVFLLIMSGIHMDIIFKSLKTMFMGEYGEIIGFLLLLFYVVVFMEHGAPIIRAISYIGLGVILKYFYRYISTFRKFFISMGITLLVNINFYKNIGFWLSVIITFFIILYLKDIPSKEGFLNKMILSWELSIVSIVSSMPLISKLGPISILSSFVIPFLLIIVEIYLVFGLLNIITLFSFYIFYKPLNTIAYYLGDIVYNLNLHPMYFKVPIIQGIIFDILLAGLIFTLKDRILKISSVLALFGIGFMLWGL